jgi:chlorophyllide a reductase subunit X
VVGRGVVLEPATMEDMCGKPVVDKPSLEVVYDAA